METWETQIAVPVWAGRRLAAAACAGGMPVVCGEWNGCVCTGVDAAVGFNIVSLSKLHITDQGTGL